MRYVAGIRHNLMTMNLKNLPFLWLWVFSLAWVLSARADIQYAGVNLSGAEFGQANLPGVYNSDYTYPTVNEVNYFQGRGMNIIRLPFRWERLQRTNNLALDATELGRLNTFVSYATGKGMSVILDPHNFARYYPNPRSDFQGATNGLLGTTVPYLDFANFWGQVASIYKTNNLVIFNLMNEPANMLTENWLAAANAAIAAIRSAGATNLILVPGNGYTGAWTWLDNWYGTPNGTVMSNIIDPGNNFAYDAHQYLDSDGSGTTTNIVNAGIGMQRLVIFTAWLRLNHRKGFLGEFAVDNSMIGGGSSQIGDEALTNMLAHMQTNSDVWLGWTWWGGGPWWGASSYFHIDPASFSTPVDQPVMTVIKSFFPVPVPLLVSTNSNQFQFNAQPGFVYQPQTSPDLTGGSWTSYGTAVTGSGITGIGQRVTITMPVGSGNQGYYRVRVTHVP